MARRAALTWDEFEARLAAALAEMPLESFLIVTTPSDGAGEAHYVQFAHVVEAQGGSTVLRAEAVGSGNLDAAPLTPAQEEQLVGALGWRSPKTGDSVRNYRTTWAMPAPYADVARLAVRTLREVYGIADPLRLRYVHELFERTEAPDPDLGIDPDRLARTKPRRRRVRRTVDELVPLVEKALRGGRSRGNVIRDGDGDYPIEVGSTVIYVRPLEGVPPVVEVFAPILHDIGESPALLAAINEINGHVRFGRAFWANRQIIVAMEITAVDLTVAQIAFAIAELGNLADHLDDALHAQFGGATTFPTRPALVN